MDKEEVLEMKKKQINYQMDELTKLRKFNMIDEYRQFKNVFLDSVSNIYISCFKEDEKFNDLITNFIVGEINKFNRISNYIMENKRDENGVLTVEYLRKYKYCQQIIHDYLKIAKLD